MSKRLLFAVLFFVLAIILPAKALALMAPSAGQTLGLREPIHTDTPHSVITAWSQCEETSTVTNMECWASKFLTGGIFSGGGLHITGYPMVRRTASGAQQTVWVPGALGFFQDGISYMASVPPASSADYVKYMASRIQVPGVQTAYAASGDGGLGFNSLQPVLMMWTAFRNLAYIIFAIIFVLIGLMIILRIKVDPKTVASIQTALPKIIFALIVVTFSYAIAGLIIDLMYLSIAIILAVLKSISGFQDTALILEKDLLSGQTIFSYMQSGGIAISSSAFVAVNDIVQQFVGGIGTPAQGLGQVLGIVSGGLAFLIVAIAILWALFKTWLMLLGAYVNIILSIVFAPLQLMLDAVPGQGQFQAWLRTLLANVLSFPLVIGMMFVGLALSGSSAQQIGSATANANIGINPLTGFVPPLIGGNSQPAVQALIGVGVLLTIPKALEILKGALKAPEYKWATAWMDAAKFGWGQTGGRGYDYWYKENVAKQQAIAQAYKEAKLKYQIQPYTVDTATGAPVLTPPPNQLPQGAQPNIIIRNLPSSIGGGGGGRRP